VAALDFAIVVKDGGAPNRADRLWSALNFCAIDQKSRVEFHSAFVLKSEDI